MATHFEMSSSIQQLLVDFLSGNILAVSDGSFNKDAKAGAAGWVVESLDGLEFIRGGGRTVGSVTSQGAYRSELIGLVGLSMALWSIEQTLADRVPSEIIIACDGISALFKSITKDKERLHTRDVHFDVLSSIIGFWHEMTAVPFPVHVRGHQDDSVEVNELPRLAQMNVAMDSLAKSILRSSLATRDTVPLASFSFGLPSISCIGVPIESAFAKSSVTLISTRKARIFWLDKFKITSSAAPSVNWLSFGRAFKALGFNRQIFVRKWLSKTIPVGTTLRKRKYGIDNRCPRCHCYDESPLHVLICPDSETRTHRSALLTALWSSIHDMDTCPLLSSSLQSVITLWLRNPRRFQLTSCNIDPSLSQCMASQAALGWYSFLCGFHSSAIMRHQQQFFLQKRCQKSAPYWASKLTRVLWNFIHEMWTHRSLAKHSINDLAPDAPEICSLRTAALLELEQGATTLPALYRSYFNITPTSLLAMSNTDLRIWFKSIRIFRESTSTSVTDVFSSPGPFRSWVGLGPTRANSGTYQPAE